MCIPEDPCMEYLPTLTPKVIQNNPNVGKYSIHGSLGYIYIYEIVYMGVSIVMGVSQNGWFISWKIPI